MFAANNNNIKYDGQCNDEEEKRNIHGEYQMKVVMKMKKWYMDEHGSHNNDVLLWTMKK